MKMQPTRRATKALIYINVALCLGFIASLPWTFLAAVVVDPPTYISLVTLYLAGNFSATIGMLSSLPEKNIHLLCHTAATTVLFIVVLTCALMKTVSVLKGA